MKGSTVLVIIIFCAASLIRCAGHKKEKYFIGQVEYTYSYESSTLNTDSLTNAKPFKSIFNYDLDNYQSRFIGKDTFTYFYSGQLNKGLSETNRQQNYECEDYGQATDSILSYTVYDTDEKILGQPCSIIEYQTKIFWNRYYVSKEIKIAPATYQKHLAYNWSFYGEKTGGGIILKLEHRFKNYIMKGTATSLKTYDKDFKALEIDELIISAICNSKN